MSDGKVKGVVHVIEETKTYGQKGFRKRLVVLEQDKGRFTNYVPLEFTNDNCDAVNDLAVGNEIEVDFRLNGRKWQKDPSSEVKFFVNAEAMTFRVLGGAAGSAAAGASDSSATGGTGDSASINDAFSEAADDDEVPF